MKNYIKLFNFELGRFLKFYLILIAITIVSQITGVIVSSRSYLSDANEFIYVNQGSMESFLEQYGQMSMHNITRTLWFLGPIALCVVTLLIYIFFIWYRDWFGKNTFIYRLLMLPTARMNVYLAKASTIFLMVLGLISLQLVLIPIEGTILQSMVPVDFRLDMSIQEVIGSFDYFGILVPYSFTQFIIHYGIGFMAVFIVFTAILFERSFRLKGIVLGIVYIAISVVIFISPLLVDAFLVPNYFYAIELFVMEIVVGLLVIAGSIWMSNYLLNRKIRI
ncbi:hypothetical protein [Oceanobacillus bengalensis]|uniref:Uncharacterized protein n=1 Tax=Oceanobacillus bengalensis TaxID=1435466 RepID=A0A494Z322_9BACI|nr:hypothetical protein [Oceanobacillus bengalensis]RKQ16832.1 hypothetical protein D8M05_06150 [Oceanobacillus bengalensis]